MKAICLEVDYSTLSHELRIPLTGILGMAELLKGEAGLTDEQKEEIAIILQSGNRLLSFIEKILNSPKEDVDNIRKLDTNSAKNKQISAQVLLTV